MLRWRARTLLRPARQLVRRENRLGCTFATLADAAGNSAAATSADSTSAGDDGASAAQARVAVASDVLRDLYREGWLNVWVAAGILVSLRSQFAAASPRLPAGEPVVAEKIAPVLLHYCKLAHASYARSYDVLQERSGLSPDDVVSARWTPDVLLPGYFLALQHERKEVVLAIRGSSSVSDFLTNFRIEPVPFLDGHAHNGMLRAAQWFVNNIGPQLRALRRQHPDYQLRLTGHSLGAGAASLATMMLRAEFPDVHCYSFAPPACVSMPTALRCGSYITALANGDDCIPRLHADTVEHLRKIAESVDWRAELRELTKLFALIDSNSSNSGAAQKPRSSAAAATEAVEDRRLGRLLSLDPAWVSKLFARDPSELKQELGSKEKQRTAAEQAADAEGGGHDDGVDVRGMSRWMDYLYGGTTTLSSGLRSSLAYVGSLLVSSSADDVTPSDRGRDLPLLYPPGSLLHLMPTDSGPKLFRTDHDFHSTVQLSPTMLSDHPSRTYVAQLQALLTSETWRTSGV